MAVSETTTKLQVRMQLDNGTTASGATKTLAVNLGTLKVDPSLSADAFNDKAMAIVDALSMMFANSIYYTDKVATSELESN